MPDFVLAGIGKRDPGSKCAVEVFMVWLIFIDCVLGIIKRSCTVSVLWGVGLFTPVFESRV